VQLQCTHSAVSFQRRMSATAPGNILIGGCQTKYFDLRRDFGSWDL